MRPARPGVRPGPFPCKPLHGLRIAGVFLSCALLPEGAAAAQQGVTEAQRAGIDFFEKRIRPVLAERCYSCHSVGAEKVKGGLLLDSREGLLRGGHSGPAVVPGDPDRSLLVKAVARADGEFEMPPRENDRLTREQVAELIAWVKMGAPAPPTGDPRPANPPPSFDWVRARKFWSFQPVKGRPLPAVEGREWPRNPIDRFILARLKKGGSSPRRQRTAGRSSGGRRST